MLIDENTGEVINTKEETFTNSLNEDGYRIPSHKFGARIFSEVQFPGEMSYGDIGKMTCLAKMMIAKNNMLGYRGRGKIVPYEAEEIGGLVGLSGRRSKEFVWKMINLGVMCREDANDETRYFINPAYFIANGQRLSLDMFIRFQKNLIPLLPKWVVNEFLRQVNVKKDHENLLENFRNATKAVDRR
jgi:hypothetical protein